MVDIVKTIKAMFHTEKISERESLGDFDARFTIKGNQFPDKDSMLALGGYINSQDSLQITVDQDYCLRYNQQASIWEDDYQKLLDTVDSDTDYEIQIHIRKEANRSISIYNWDCVEDYIQTFDSIDFLEWLSRRFAAFGTIEFVTYDQSNVYLQGRYFSIHSQDKEWNTNRSALISEGKDRLKVAQSLGYFLDRNQYQLLPDYFDFESHINAQIFEDIFSIFRNVLSFAYLANCSYFKDGKIVLQMSPDKMPCEFGLKELGLNSAIYDLYKWVSSDNHQIDKAIVARNVLSNIFNGKFVNIDANSIATIRNNYELSLKGNVEKYIETRERLSDYIGEISSRVQQIVKEIASGLKTSFIGAIGFAISLILTDSIDIEKWIATKAPANVILVCKLFVAVTVIYLIVTIADEIWQWKHFDKEYKTFKKSLDGLITDQELKEILGSNIELKDAWKNLIVYSVVLYFLWVLLISASIVFIIRLSG